jgi:hypothetical protein
MAAATKKKKRKEEAYPWKVGASSGHITNLKQSILETFDIYGTACLVCFISTVNGHSNKKEKKAKNVVLVVGTN